LILRIVKEKVKILDKVPLNSHQYLRCGFAYFMNFCKSINRPRADKPLTGMREALIKATT
jgi:hypothetical protein